MRRSKEIMVLLTLLVGAMAFVLWYVIDRRAQNRAAPPVAARPLAPAPPVDLTQHDGRTIDFSTGSPVVKDTPENQAAIDAAVQDITAATQGVVFKAAPQVAPPPRPEPAAPPQP